MEDQHTRTGNPLLIPFAIVVAGILIAGAVFYGGSASSPALSTEEMKEKGASSESGTIESIRPIDGTDHIRGNPDAPVMIVEYSDFECPFCKQFHDTMNEVMEEYGEKGEVAWVYRHFPLDQLHPVKARAEAVASECINELGGNDAFWEFADRFFAVTPSNNRTDIENVIPQIVREMGLGEDAFVECMNNGAYDEHVESDVRNAIETGGRGTPWSIVIAPNGTLFPLSGAQPYASVARLIEIALKEQ